MHPLKSQNVPLVENVPQFESPELSDKKHVKILLCITHQAAWIIV